MTKVKCRVTGGVDVLPVLLNHPKKQNKVEFNPCNDWGCCSPMKMVLAYPITYDPSVDYQRQCY